MIKNILASALAFGIGGLALFATPVLSVGESDYLCADKSRTYQTLVHQRWSQDEIPVGVYIPPPPPEFQVENKALYIPLVKQAFQAWEKQDRRIHFKFVSTQSDARIVIKWHNHFQYQAAGSPWGMAYYPHPRQDSKGKIYHTSQVHLAVRAQPGTTLVGTDAILFSEKELMAIATHEVGHALGLHHSDNPDDLMAPYASFFSANSQRTITARDVRTLKRLYDLSSDLKKSPCSP